MGEPVPYGRILRLLLLLGLMIAPGAAGASGLVIEIVPGLDQNRNAMRPGTWTTQWLRQNPLTDQPFVVTCQGPQSWLKQPPSPGGLTAVVEANGRHLPILQGALRRAGLLTVMQSPGEKAAILAATLRPVEAQEKATLLQSRVWQLWEVLADAPHADALSVSVAVLQVLREAGVTDGRLARYPTRKGGQAFGVLVPENRAVDGDWGWRVGERALIPVASSMPPRAELLANLEDWSWEEILSQGWLEQQIAGASDSADLRGGDLSDQAGSMDLCTQAKALGLECAEGLSLQDRERMYLILTSLVSLGILVALLHTWRRRRRRRERVRQKLEEKKEGRF